MRLVSSAIWISGEPESEPPRPKSPFSCCFRSFVSSIAVPVGTRQPARPDIGSSLSGALRTPSRLCAGLPTPHPATGLFCLSEHQLLQTLAVDLLPPNLLVTCD